ncbi:glycoside hydrolase family 79 protein [Xylaria sp. CBS 124048]|nr:glycoside hydrolase family 79 protein [Xylaria sp. CBS 124048]
MLPNPHMSAGLLLALGELVLTASIPRPPSFVQLSATVPAGSSPEIDPDFQALAFEQASFVRYAQDDEGNANAFSTNLLDAIYSRTGGKPIIRLGGTSPDYGKYLPGQTEPALPVAEQNNYQDIGHTTIGPSYWQLAKNFPDALYMIQVPLATRNISEPIAWAQSAVETIGIDSIFSIQPGNEADLYSNTFTGANGIPLHPPQYQGRLTNETYVGNWTQYVSAIKKAVPGLPSERFFTAFDTSTHFGPQVVDEKFTFAVDRCFDLGIDSGNVVKEVAHHYYQGQAGTAATLGSTLMNLTITHTHLDQYKSAINWLKANKPGVPFVLSEVGNSLQMTNTYEYQARLGSTLWMIDFYLYSMAIGIARINYQQIMHSGYDMWLPVASAGMPAQVFSNYYSQPFVADFIVCLSSLSHLTRNTKWNASRVKKESHAPRQDVFILIVSQGNTGKTRVSQLSVNVTNIAAYAAYDNGTPKRVAVVNMNYWNQTSSTEARGGITVNLGVPKGVRNVTVYHVNSPWGAGAAADTITYGGSQWTFDSLGEEVKNVRLDTEAVVVRNGVASVKVASSEAVLVWL